MQALAPITVSAVDFDVALVADGISAAWTPGYVRCANESPYALQCLLGADMHWLQPWSVDLWPVHSVTSMHVHPVALVSPVPTPPWSTLLVTVAQAWESIPGVYPAALDRQSANYVQPAPLRVLPTDSGIYTTAPNTTLTNVVYPLPAGATAVRYEINQLALNCTWSGNTIRGNVTGKQYNFGVANAGGTGGFDETWAIDPEDSTLLLSINTAGSANAVSYWFTAPAQFVAARLVGPGTAGFPIIVEAANTPASWQSFPFSKRIDVTANGTDTAIGISAAGKIVVLGPTSFFSSASNRLQLKDGSGGMIVAVLPWAAGAPPTIFPFNGRLLTVSNDLFFNLANGQEVELTVTYNLQ